MLKRIFWGMFSYSPSPRATLGTTNSVGDTMVLDQFEAPSLPIDVINGVGFHTAREYRITTPGLVTINQALPLVDAAPMPAGVPDILEPLTYE